MNRDEHFMRLALKEAQKAYEEDEIPVGALIVSNDIIIAKGYNQTERMCDPTAHAEIIAITSATNKIGAKYLKDCTLYVTLEPCIMCAGAIGWAQIRRVVIGASDLKRGYQTYAPKALHPKTEVINGILEEESSELIKSFFKQKR